MLRSGATQTLMMLIAPGASPRTDTINDTGSSANGSTGCGARTGLTGRAHPLTVTNAKAMRTAALLSILDTADPTVSLYPLCEYTLWFSGEGRT